MIQVRDLRKAYGPVVAVDGISFEIRRGETFGLLGPNGAGKTTTMHLLAGLLTPDEGEIRINGLADPTHPAVRRCLGIAPQALSVYEDLTAVENLRFFARLHGLHGRRLRRRVAESLEQAGLQDRGSDRVCTYSGGMKRRLHLVCGLVHEPQVLFLDEPTIGVDPQSRHHILTDIEALKQRGTTVLLTTHYMEEAERLCDRVAIMDHGKVLALDEVPAMLRQYGGTTTLEATLEHPAPSPLPVAARLDGNTLWMETDRPFEAINRLGDAGLTIRSLSVHQPDLETVFLHLTGRRLRD